MWFRTAQDQAVKMAAGFCHDQPEAYVWLELLEPGEPVEKFGQ